MNSAINIMRSINRRLIAILLGSLLLVSCGGSIETAGIGGTGISYGTVTDFGSIILNGNRIDDSTASVTLDGIAGDELLPHRGLKKGMVVKASGISSGNTGTASSIEYRDNLEGPVCDASVSIDGISTLRVLGQTVIIDATTIVDNNATISVGDIVEVSGLPDNLQQIHASFIEVKDPIDAVIEVKGRVSNVIGSTFTINALDVDYSSIGIINGVPTEGQFVEVKGTFTCGSTRDMLIASSIELEPEGAGAILDGVNAEVEGFVTELTLDGFKMGSREILITGSTSFLPEDFDFSDIMVGAKVEAEGPSNNGVLTATKISFRENVKLESDVATVTGSSFTLVDLPGINITTNSVTEPPGVIVTLGDHIRVRGIEGPNNTVLATRIDDRTGSQDAFLQGMVDTKIGNIISVLGIAVDTGSIIQFQDVNEIPISRTTFLALVQPGTLVKFQGTLTGSTIVYGEAELEDD